jgi:hypothetical protein
MLLLMSGLAIFAAAIAMLWHFKPRQGRVHRWVAMPVFQAAIPITITTAAALGLAMIVAGALS